MMLLGFGLYSSFMVQVSTEGRIDSTIVYADDGGDGASDGGDEENVIEVRRRARV